MPVRPHGWRTRPIRRNYRTGKDLPLVLLRTECSPWSPDLMSIYAMPMACEPLAQAPDIIKINSLQMENNRKVHGNREFMDWKIEPEPTIATYSSCWMTSMASITGQRYCISIQYTLPSPIKKLLVYLCLTECLQDSHARHILPYSWRELCHFLRVQ